MPKKTDGTAAAPALAKEKQVSVTRPKFGNAVFTITGNAPLVIHRFDEKTKRELEAKQETGKAAGAKKNREPKDPEKMFNDARYISSDGWDGFHAGAIRNALISACRLVGMKMTLMKLTVFVLADGWDAKEPQIPLIRIYGNPVMQKDIARVETGKPYVTIRAAYHNWKAKIRIRWDMDQCTLEDLTNLMVRVGMQVGLCEGRPDSKNSAGMGWGTFDVEAK